MPGPEIGARLHGLGTGDLFPIDTTRHSKYSRLESEHLSRVFVLCHVLLCCCRSSRSGYDINVRSSTPGNRTPSPSHPTFVSDHMSIACTVPCRLAVRTHCASITSAASSEFRNTTRRYPPPIHPIKSLHTVVTCSRTRCTHERASNTRFL